MKSRDLFDYISNNWPAKVLSIAAAIVLFLFYRNSGLEKRFFNVPLSVIVNENYIPSGSYPRSSRIILRGNAEDIYLINENDIEVYADLSSHMNEGSFRAPVQFRKKGNALYIDPLEITVEPLEVTISLERKISKSVEVSPVTDGFERKGYELVQYLITPTSVEVEGPKSDVEGILEVYTREIDLSDRFEDFTIMVRLDNDNPDITFPGGDVIEYHGIITEAMVVKTFTPVDVITLDLPESLTLEEMPDQGFIKIQTTHLLLEEMSINDFRLILDCSFITEPGEYSISAEPDVPSGVIILQYDPINIILKVGKEVN